MGKQELIGPRVPVQTPPRRFNSRFNRADSPASLPLPGRRLGAMDQQSGLSMQASQSFPQQFVQLVGHCDPAAARWIRPRFKTPQMGILEQDTPIG